MLFWVLLAITIIAVVIAFMADDFMPVGAASLTLLIGSFVSFLVIFFSLLIFDVHPDYVSEKTYKLRSLGTSSGVEGRLYFLGGGYVDDKRVLNYITDEGGAIKVRKSDADSSTIYEGSDTPSATVRHYDLNNGWIITWPLGSHDTYEFHIPAGSVMSDYTVDNK